MNRTDFQQLAELRLQDAEAMLQVGRYEAAYYLAGYAVECAIKACIAKRTGAESFPPRNAARLYTHHFGTLLQAVDLEQPLRAAASPGSAFARNWAVVEDWSEESRYTWPTEQDARALCQAIGDPQEGVLEWFRQRW